MSQSATSVPREGGERVVCHRRGEDACDDGKRRAETNGEDESEQLRLVADFSDGHGTERDEEGFQEMTPLPGATPMTHRGRPAKAAREPKVSPVQRC